MKRFVVPALALVLATAPSLAEAQGRGGRGFGMGQPNPIQAILSAADSLQLNLTAEQRTRLGAIQTELDEENAPRMAQIQQAMGGGAPDMATLMPIMQEIQTANTAAIEDARGVLNADQLAKVNPFLETLGGRGRGGRGGARGGGARGGGGAPG